MEGLIIPIFRSVDQITQAHWIKATKVNDKVEIFKRNDANSEWETWNPLKRGAKMPTVAEIENIEKVNLSKEKIKDLQSALRFIPGNKLSYVPENELMQLLR